MYPEAFFRTLASAGDGTLEMADIKAMNHSTSHKRYGGGIHSKTAIYVNWAIACYRLLSTPHPTTHGTFPCTAFDASATEGRYLGFTFEDWNRAICLIKWFLREQHENRGATGSRALAPSKSIAKTPRYLQDEDQGRLFVSEVQSSDDNEDLGDMDKPKDLKLYRRFQKAVQNPSLRKRWIWSPRNSMRRFSKSTVTAWSEPSTAPSKPAVVPPSSTRASRSGLRFPRGMR